MVRYRVCLPRPHNHLYEIEAEFPPTEGPLEVCLPVWTPGSYMVREYARHLREMRAATASGSTLSCERVDKRTWRIEAHEGPTVLRYRVYAHELTVRTSHLDDSHAFFTGATLFVYSEPLRNEPHRVELGTPPGWRSFTALPEENGGFVAKDYDELVDSPFELGPHEPVRFTAAGVPHELVIWGGAPSPDRTRLAADLPKVCEKAVSVFGELPVSRYVFLLFLADRGRGGLEHRASSALLFPHLPLVSGKGWEDFLTLVAHEYFHLWNVKRLIPRALVPFDYGKECHTTLLWAFEGVTAYYDNLLVRRAGLMSPERYLVRLGETLSLLLATPGRKTMSLAEASFTAWIKLYRPDESTPNSAISYYLKGEVVAALLDLEIRRATNDEKSLDDVMRLSWARYGDGRGVPEDGVEAAAREVGGEGLSAFFDRAIRGTDELDFSVFEHVGLTAKRRVRESPTDKGGTPPRPKEPAGSQLKGWLGVTVRGSKIGTVLEGSPAEEAGLYSEDEIVALDGFKVDGSGLLARCEERVPGERVRVSVFRKERLMEIPVRLGQQPEDAVWLERVENPSPEQERAYARWLETSGTAA